MRPRKTAAFKNQKTSSVLLGMSATVETDRHQNLYEKKNRNIFLAVASGALKPQIVNQLSFYSISTDKFENHFTRYIKQNVCCM